MRSLVLSTLAAAGVLLSSPRLASAQWYGQPQPPPQGHGQQGPYYGQPPPQGYGQQGPYYGQPPQGGYPPRPPPSPPCCTASLRINPIDLFFQKARFEADFRLLDWLSFEVAPTYIFGIPNADKSEYSGKGFGASGKLGFWFEGQALRGFFAKALVDASRYQLASDYGSMISFTEVGFGMLLGSQRVFGTDGGFTFSGGFGAMYIPNSTTHTLFTGPPTLAKRYECAGLEVNQPCVNIERNRVDVIGQLAVGYTF